MSTAEVEAVIQILREDPDAEDKFLNETPRDPYNRFIPLVVWEDLIGKPNARNEILGNTYWVYETSDGQLTVEVHAILSESIDQLRVLSVRFPVSNNPNQPIDKATLRKRVLQAKAAFDTKAVFYKSMADRRRIADEKLPLDAKPGKTVANENSRTDKNIRDATLENARNSFLTEAAKITTAEQAKRQELDRKSTHALALQYFADIAKGPHFYFSKELGVAPQQFDFSPAAKELMKVVSRGIEETDWSDLMRHLNINPETHLTRKSVEKALETLQYGGHPHAYRVILRSDKNLSKAIGCIKFDGSVDWAPSVSRHPDGSAWVLSWSPLTNEGFFFESSRLPAGTNSYLGRAIDQAVETAQARANLDGTQFDIAAVRRKAASDLYQDLKKRWLDSSPQSDTTTMPDAPAKGSVAVDESTKQGLRKLDISKRPIDGGESFLKVVSLTKPYPGATQDKISIQYAVMELAKQAGLGYEFDTSRQNTDPVCRQWIKSEIKDKPLRDALRSILDPVGLTFSVTSGKIVLNRKSR